MKKQQHTPGPWRYKSTIGGFAIQTTKSQFMQRFAFLDTDRAYPQEANARLIAAAPCLLKAAKELIEADRNLHYAKSGTDKKNVKEGVRLIRLLDDKRKCLEIAVAKADGNETEYCRECGEETEWSGARPWLCSECEDEKCATK